MLRCGCDHEGCAYCPKSRRRPTVYAARAFAKQAIMMNKPLCPRVAELYVPLNNFKRSPAPENLVQRMTGGRIPTVEIPIAKPNIGIMVRPPHVSRHKPKVKEPIKEKPIIDVGQYKLRRLSGQWMESVY